MYAWEEIFLEKLIKLRKEEIAKLRRTTGLRTTFKFIFLSSTSMVSKTHHITICCILLINHQ